MITILPALFSLPVDSRIIDAAIGFVGLLVAFASVWLQWKYFKRTHPMHTQPDAARPQAAPANPRNRWKVLYWREVRATFFLALLSLMMVAAIVFFHSEITMASLASLLFWMGMFFYNLWVAQWYAWRIATKRKR